MTHTPDANSAQTTISNISSAIASPGSFAPILTTSSTATHPAQKRPSSIYRLFHPPMPFPVVARGVTVYVLWNHTPDNLASLASLPPQVSQYRENFGSWYMTYFTWRLTSDASPEPWIDETEIIDALATMIRYIDELAAAQASNRGNNQRAQPVYELLHVREVKLKISPLFRLRTYRLHYHMDKKDMQQAIINVQRAFVFSLQKCFHLLEEDISSGIMPSTFGHYDRNTHSRGWIVLNPVRTLLVGVGRSDVYTFAGLLQHRDIDPTQQQRGITLDRYDDVLGRVRLWNAALDINETVDQVANLASSGQKSTDGQVLLNLTLAAIGILVSLSPSLHFSTIHLWGTFGLLSLASILFWLHARNINKIFLYIGMLSIIFIVLIDIIPF